MANKQKDYTLKNNSGQDQDLRVVELFAGVGGFRVGLEGYGKRKLKGYRTVWNNQWEPATKKQHASEVYVERFGSEGHSNVDIAQVSVASIPEHDLLVGGFPCQDYSVARTLSQASGLIGKKGVLWWAIHRILNEKGKKAPSYLMLENVDRLLKSPAAQRGRDFAMMLASLNDLGYIVEWRIINAAEYGMPQRRRRIFILGYKKSTAIGKRILKAKNAEAWVTKDGTIAKAFPVQDVSATKDIEILGDLPVISNNFNNGKSSTQSPFLKAGLAIDRKVTTFEVAPLHAGSYVTLGQVLENEKNVAEEFFIKKEDVSKWEYLKGAKNETRKGKDGYVFTYTEGSMAFPDALNKASRTIITAEGGSAPSRFKHVVRTKSGRLRRLLPIELERLCMFPDNHTASAVATKRAFFMGNALVVGVIERLGRSLLKQIEVDT
ncbi:MAG: DNA (cytosine-5-)-methyltransferase [Candidatus Paceibacterota bacterium]